MNYLFNNDLESLFAISEMDLGDLAKELNVTRLTISNWLNSKNEISDKHLELFYDYVYAKGIRFNQIKSQFYREDVLNSGEVILFHGAKSEIVGDLSLQYSKKINDFGPGFYCGENLEQSVMFVSNHKGSSLYMLKFNPEKLRVKEYKVDKEWMLTVAYYRGRLNNNLQSAIVKKIISETENADYIVAPIADNRMYEIIDSFIDGLITDVQCQHCLSATNLGKQYVFISQKALDNVTLLERCYLSENEKYDYQKRKNENYSINQDKIKLALRQYRNQGNYIEDLLK